jgi:predicted O-linked N-acetylglucosamine transferase (SPINDLY family)
MSQPRTASSGLRIAGKAPVARPRAAAPSPRARRAWGDGVALARRGEHARALPLFESAVKAAPEVALYWLNLATTQRKLHRTAQAMESARRAFALDAASEVACHLLAELLRTNNRDAEALRTLRALDPATPRSTQHWLLQGAVQMALREWQDAAVAFLQVLAEKPAHIEAYMQLGFALANLRRFGEAAECFRTVTILEPAELGAAIYAAHYAAWACDWRQGGEDHERMLASFGLQTGRDKTPAFSPFCLLSMNDDAALHRRAAQMEARRIAAAARAAHRYSAPAPGPAGHPEAARALAEGRIRVGFVSADFRTHATSMLLVRTLERLDRARFEVVLYSHGPDDGTPLRRRMEAAADRFVDCTELNAAEQAARIRADGTAILVDMSGYTASSRLSVFALRPAPVQALWLAYPSTTGADFIDYLIGDPILTPSEHAADFSECLAQLPLCYEPTDERREHPDAPTRAACGLPDGAFVFACFNQSYKITEEVFSRWCRILQRVEGSVLWLLVPQQEIQAALRERAVERGIDAARVIFAPFVPPGEHLGRLQQADLFLDTFPYGAHTTCSDALWMGLPVLTQVGRSFSARVAASLLAAVDLPALAVADAQAYEERAVALATTQRAELERIRTHLREGRLGLPLFDNERFTRELAALLERMVQRWQQGLAPQALPAA